MALEIRSFVNMMNQIRNAVGEEPWEMRIGINTGSLAAGIIGTTKFGYDIWGDSVNPASRMESYGEPGKINISRSTYREVAPYCIVSYRGEVPVKQRGSVSMYFVERIRAEFADDEGGRTPNDRLLKLVGLVP